MTEKEKILIKTFRTYIIIDYRTGEIRCNKRKKDVSAYEVIAELNIKINIPKKQDIKFDAELTLSEQKIGEISSELV